MTPPVRLLFDDCISKHAIPALREIVRFTDGQVELSHLADLALEGEMDDVWVPRISGEPWIVISADRGKKNHGGKLPLICQRNSVTHVLMSSPVHQGNTFDKMRAIFAVWPDLLIASLRQRGFGYKLKVRNQGFGVVLDPYYVPEGADSQPAPQHQLKLKW